MASRIRFSVTDSFTPEMDELRQTFTSNPWPDGTSIDPFDNCSFHILAFVENQLAGMVRLSAHPISPLASWVLKPDSLRSGIRIVEATRAVVSPEFRGNGIYKALMANAVIWAFQHNILWIVGAIELPFPLLPFLRELGFSDFEQQKRFLNPPNGETVCQVIKADVRESYTKAETKLREFQNRSESNALSVDLQLIDDIKTVTQKNENGVASITLNRPDRHNAMDFRMANALKFRLQSVEHSDTQRVVLLRGAGKSFCSGADLRSLFHHSTSDAMRFVSFGADLTDFIEQMQTPVISSVHGNALGGGLELALASTIRICSENSSFAFPEIDLDIIPGWHGIFRAANVMGASRTAYLALSGHKIDANLAMQWNLVDFCLPLDAFAEFSTKTALNIATKPVAASNSIKNVLSKQIHERKDVGYGMFLDLMQKHSTMDDAG